MAILIKGMDKPTRCSICKFEFWAVMGYQCLITEEAVNIKTCPLVEVEQAPSLEDAKSAYVSGHNLYIQKEKDK